MRIQQIIVLTLVLILSSCKDNVTPKPHGYLRIDLPKTHTFSQLPTGLPFSFEHSTLSELDTLRASSRDRQNLQWYNIAYPKYNAKIHLSYIPVNNNLDSLLEESHKFVFEHTVKADAIDETPFHNTQTNVHGLLFNLKGNSASNMEFWATDSASHFLRGALYFSTTPNVDSLAPVINYIKEDIVHLINTIEWNAIN